VPSKKLKVFISDNTNMKPTVVRNYKKFATTRNNSLIPSFKISLTQLVDEDDEKIYNILLESYNLGLQYLRKNMHNFYCFENILSFELLISLLIESEIVEQYGEGALKVIEYYYRDYLMWSGNYNPYKIKEDMFLEKINGAVEERISITNNKINLLAKSVFEDMTFEKKMVFDWLIDIAFEERNTILSDLKEFYRNECLLQALERLIFKFSQSQNFTKDEIMLGRELLSSSMLGVKKPQYSLNGVVSSLKTASLILRD